MKIMSFKVENEVCREVEKLAKEWDWPVDMVLQQIFAYGFDYAKDGKVWEPTVPKDPLQFDKSIQFPERGKK